MEYGGQIDGQEYRIKSMQIRNRITVLHFIIHVHINSKAIEINRQIRQATKEIK